MIKVIYIILFLIILIGGLIGIIDTYRKDKLDTNNTKVICYSPDDRLFLFPEKHKIFSLKEVGINELESYYSLKNNGFDYKNFITDYPYNSLQIVIFCMNKNNIDDKDYEKKDIQEYNNSGIDMFMYQKSYELRFGTKKIISNKGGIYSEPTKEEEEDFINKMKEYENYVNSSYSNYDRISKLDFSIKMFELNIKYIYGLFVLYILGYICGVYIVFEIIRRLLYYIILGKFFPKEKE